MLLTPIPALFIKTSTLPLRISIHSLALFEILLISEISNSIIFAPVYSTTLFNLSLDLPVIRTFAPLSTKNFAVSLPIPRLPPVNITFLPFKFIYIYFKIYFETNLQ